MRLAGDSALGFYATIMSEVYRTIPILFKVQRRATKEIKLYLGEEKYNEIYSSSNDDSVRDAKLFLAVCNKTKNGHEFAKNFFSFNMSTSGSYRDKISIADFFAGKGEWLNSYKEFFPNEIMTIGVEPELDRFKEMKRKTTFAFNTTFEEFDSPNQIASIVLFNPPYGASFGKERNVQYFYEMMMKRNLFVSCNTRTYEEKTALMIAVLNKEDTKLMLPQFIRDFEYYTLYRVEDEKEFEKFNQFVSIWQKREYPLSDMQSEEILEKMDLLTVKINRDARFQESLYQNKKYIFSVPDKLEQRMDNHDFEKHKHLFVSDKNSLSLKWAKSLTGIDIEKLTSLEVPKSPTPSELSVLLSSGIMDGTVTREDGTKHIIAGGVKRVITETQEAEIDEETGDETLTQRKIVSSQAYLNILYADKDGNIKIKEI